MSLPEPLDAQRVARLAAELGTGGDDDTVLSNGSVNGSTPRQGFRLIARAAQIAEPVRRLVRRVARRAARPVLERAAAPGRELGRQAMAQVAELNRSLTPIRSDATEWELERGDLRLGLVNLELLKGEVRQTGEVLEQLARAIAPAFGLPAAAAALAELRERVTACERRLRHLESSSSAGDGTLRAALPADAHPAEPSVPTVATTPASTLFDYSGFERRFRGNPDEVLTLLDDRYGELLGANAPVLDVGCGRAELVALLTGRGIAAVGVDTDPSMVADARQRGLEVFQADAVTFLRDHAPGSFGAIVATHVFEHLPLDPLIELIELARTRLRPGGVLIAETPNPSSLIVLGNSYILDPTHVRPLHPKLLEFLCEAAGFRNLEVRFFAPATGFQVDLIVDPDAPPWVAQVNAAFDHLNHVLFGPQDFAIIAYAPPTSPEPGH